MPHLSYFESLIGLRGDSRRLHEECRKTYPRKRVWNPISCTVHEIGFHTLFLSLSFVVTTTGRREILYGRPSVGYSKKTTRDVWEGGMYSYGEW